MNFILERGRQIASFAEPEEAKEYLENKKGRIFRARFESWHESYKKDHSMDVLSEIPSNERDHAARQIEKQVETDYRLVLGEAEIPAWETPDPARGGKNQQTKEDFVKLIKGMLEIAHYRWKVEVIDVVEQERVKQKLVIYHEDTPQHGTVFSLDVLYDEYRSGIDPEDIMQKAAKIAKQEERYVVVENGKPIASFLTQQDAKDFLFWIKKPQQRDARWVTIAKKFEESGEYEPLNESDEIIPLMQPYLPAIRAEVDQMYQIEDTQEPNWRQSQSVTLVTEYGCPVAGFVAAEDADAWRRRKVQAEHDDRWKRWVDTVKEKRNIESALDIPKEEARRMGDEIQAAAEFKYGLRQQKPSESLSSQKTIDWQPATPEKAASEDKQEPPDKGKQDRERPKRKGR
ncbi:MAG: hypothetical protein Q4C48_03375 [Lachnospiraceae bacterium]|nr:hypothetical protein [Lachnospiraceae bacterium]